MVDLNFKYEKLLKQVSADLPFKPEISIILGSGLGDFAKSVNSIKSFRTADLPGYPPSTVEGHSGKIHLAELDDKKLLLFQGRIHFYEGYNINECILPVFISKKIGCDYLLLTNAAGGINKNFLPGDLMLATSFNGIAIKKELTDLIGISSIETKNMFLNFPSIELNRIIHSAAKKENIQLKEGVYWFSKGPSYETPAEIEMTKRLGGDAAGMSTVHEAVYGACLGMKVASVSCITNLAAGMSSSRLSHDEVTETANRVKDKFTKLLKRAILSI